MNPGIFAKVIEEMDTLKEERNKDKYETSETNFETSGTENQAENIPLVPLPGQRLT